MKYCMNCGKLLPPAANFCVNCGQSLADAAAQIAAIERVDPTANASDTAVKSEQSAATVNAPVGNENGATQDNTATAKGTPVANTATTNGAAAVNTDTDTPDAPPVAQGVGAKYGKTASDMGTSFGAPVRTHPTTDEDTVFGSAEEYIDNRDYTPLLGIAILSFFLWWLGLILWSVNKDERPGLANSALKGALTFICLLLPPLGLVLFIAWNKSRRDFARPIGLAAIFGLVLLIAVYILYIALMIYTV